MNHPIFIVIALCFADYLEVRNSCLYFSLLDVKIDNGVFGRLSVNKILICFAFVQEVKHNHIFLQLDLSEGWLKMETHLGRLNSAEFEQKDALSTGLFIKGLSLDNDLFSVIRSTSKLLFTFFEFRCCFTLFDIDKWETLSPGDFCVLLHKSINFEQFYLICLQFDLFKSIDIDLLYSFSLARIFNSHFAAWIRVNPNTYIFAIVLSDFMLFHLLLDVFQADFELSWENIEVVFAPFSWAYILTFWVNISSHTTGSNSWSSVEFDTILLHEVLKINQNIFVFSFSQRKTQLLLLGKFHLVVRCHYFEFHVLNQTDWQIFWIYILFV